MKTALGLAIDSPNGQIHPVREKLIASDASLESPLFTSSSVAFGLRFVLSNNSRKQEANLRNLPLGLIEPTDTGTIEDLTKEIIRDGEKRLMLAVLENATEDFQKYALATDARGKQLFQAAEDWIFDTDDPSFFSFESICQHLHLDSGYMRQGFVHWKSARLTRRISGCFKSASRRAG